MRLRKRRPYQLSVVLGFAALFFITVTTHQYAQSGSQFAAPSIHVSDFAGALDEQTKQRLENLLENLQQKKKIYFYVAVVQSTGGKDIFEFSRQMAHDWNLGARTSAKKSLLLVVAIDEKSAFTQFSRSVQEDLPDGVLGEMTQRMRNTISSGNIVEAVNIGVNHFIGSVARQSGLTLQDFEQSAGTSAASVSSPTPVAESPVVMPVADVSPAPPPASEEVAKATRSRRIKSPPATPSAKSSAKSRTKSAQREVSTPEDDADEAEEVELTLTLPYEPRVAKLTEFLEKHPRSKFRAHALEYLISAYAALGDQKLKNAENAAGIESLFQAIEHAPVDASDQIFTGVISQIPLNLYLRGERAAAFKAAQAIEAKFANDPKRLLSVSGFYLGIENGEEAARVAALAVKQAPDMAEAHHALALGLHISLRLDEAMAEYRKTVELDPKSKGTRRSLADLLRASGKAEEAITLYREQLSADPTDKAARTGLVLALFEVGMKDEASAELDTALREDPRNLGLLTGAAYWLAAHGDTERALDLARRAVEIEPRYTWAQIAAARALLANKQPLDAERALRYAKQYGKFPTLDYELATVLAWMGLYDEAAEALQESFVLKDGQIEARLAGRYPARESGFLELLAPERRASLFQFKAADTPANAAMIKSLAAFHALVNDPAEKPNETATIEAAKEFASGEDSMRVYRQLYAASRLLRKNVGLRTAYDLAEAAKSGIDAGMEVPAATVAVQADELRELRARALASGTTPYQAEAPRSALSNIVRGRVEDLQGWVLFNEEKHSEAVDHLKRAASTIPEGTPAWRTAVWHLGAALEQTDQKEEALNNYIRSYVAGDADPVRRKLIEQLYVKIHGSLDGLDQRLAGSPTGVSVSSPAASSPTTNTPSPTTTEATASGSPEPAASQPQPSTSPTPAVEPSPTPSAEKPVDEKPAEVPKTDEAAKETPAKVEPNTEAAQKTNSEPTLTQDEAMAKAASRMRSIVKITGRVVDANNKGIASVVVILISPRGTVLAATTDAEGKYSFNVSPSQRNYRLVPSKEGYQFDPVDRAVVAFLEDLKEIVFVGKAQ